MSSEVHPFFTVIYGPTAVGKTAFSLELASALSARRQIGSEIINGDMGQLYTPLSIGTAKPDWRNQPVPHHLFDVVDKPVAYSAHAYRSACLDSMDSIAARGNAPIIVGGSGFYVKSLFYPFCEPLSKPLMDSTTLTTSGQPFVPVHGQPFISDQCLIATSKLNSVATSNIGPLALRERSESNGYERNLTMTSWQEQSLWEQLEKIDPERAQAIHPNDHYRIVRALELWQRTGLLPSSLKPAFELPAPCLMIFLDRETDELVDIMKRRVYVMLEQGFLDEVRMLAPEWRAFVAEKGLIGYPEACALLEGEIKTEAVFVEALVKNTYAYARRQRIFWRSLKKALSVDKRVMIHEINLTFTDHALYIKQLLDDDMVSDLFSGQQVSSGTLFNQPTLERSGGGQTLSGTL